MKPSIQNNNSANKGLNFIGNKMPYLQGIPVAGGTKKLRKRKGQND